MKRRSILMIVIAMSLLLSACGGADDALEVEFPGYLATQNFGELDDESVKELESEEAGIENAKIDKDGNLTIQVTQEHMDEVKEDTRRQIESMILELQDSEEFPFIDELTHDENYTQIRLVVNEAYDEQPEMGRVLTALLGGTINTYQAYLKEDLALTLTVEDADGSELEKIVYPDDVEDFLEFDL